MTEHAAFNDAIRQAAGRVDVPQPVPSYMDKPGVIFGGGGSSAPPRRATRSNEIVNARLRRAARVVRDVQLGHGVNFDLSLDDPWGH
jgi:hypothetical protein